MNEEVVIETQAVEAVEQKPDKQEQIRNNLVAMRLKLEREEEARKQAERRAEEAEKRAQQLQTTTQSAQSVSTSKIDNDDDNDFFGSDPDDYVQNKQHQRVSKKITSKQREQDEAIASLNQKIAMLETMTATAKISDFDQIVNNDNLKTLERLYPEEYELMRTSSAPLSVKSKAAYNILKNYGVIDNSVQEVARKIDDNKRKPLSASVSSAQQSPTPLSKYNDEGRRIMTEAERDRINKEVERKRSLPII